MPKDTAPEDRPVAPSELSNMARSFGPRGERARPEGLGIFVPPERDPELVAIARGDSDIADDDG